MPTRKNKKAKKIKVTKAVVLAAGLGTRSLPATKAISKSMLPVFNKPVAHYIVDDLIRAGITEIIWVISSTGIDLQNYFDKNFELEYKLQEKGKTKLLKQVQAISKMANMIFVYQHEALGTGHALQVAKTVIQPDEPFIVFNGDDAFDAKIPIARQAIDIFNKYQAPVVAVTQTKDVHKYGIVAVKKLKNRLYLASDLIEKPTFAEAPSNLASIGCFVFKPDVWQYIDKLKISKEHQEIVITDAVKKMMNKHKFYAFEYTGTRYDCGDWLGYSQAFINFALRDSNIKNDLKKYLKKKIK